MKLRKGKPKTILDESIDSALLAVEVYNKPRTTFRTQAFILLMIIAWTRLFHAYFHQTIGEKYFYKAKGSNRYEKVDGEKKTWTLLTCLSKYNKKLSESVKENIKFFLKFRNKIAHRGIDKSELDSLVFGECQAFLMNYESLLIELFGSEYALNENLAFALQFSSIRTKEQETASRRVRSADLQDIQKYVRNYRESLDKEIFASQEYSIKLDLVPRISNTNRNDLAIKFVHWDKLSEEGKEKYRQLTVLTKDRVIKQPVVNHGVMKPGAVLKQVNKECRSNLSHYDHRCLYTIFGIRPASSSDDPSKTNKDYCYYDELHQDYIYKKNWVEILIKFINAKKMSKDAWRHAFKEKRKCQIEYYI